MQTLRSVTVQVDFGYFNPLQIGSSKVFLGYTVPFNEQYQMRGNWLTASNSAFEQEFINLGKLEVPNPTAFINGLILLTASITTASRRNDSEGRKIGVSVQSVPHDRRLCLPATYLFNGIRNGSVSLAGGNQAVDLATLDNDIAKLSGYLNSAGEYRQYFDTDEALATNGYDIASRVLTYALTIGADVANPKIIY